MDEFERERRGTADNGVRSMEARDDEREALAKVIRGVHGPNHMPWKKVAPVYRKTAGAVLAAGYRRHPEPETTDDQETEDVCGNCNAGIPDDYRRQVTDEMVDRAIGEYLNLHRDASGRISLQESMRSALEAALRVPVGEEKQ